MKEKKRFKIPISVKLIVVMIGLMLAANAALTYVSSMHLEEISIRREEDANRDQSQARAIEVENLVINYVEKAQMIGSLLLKQTGAEREKSLDLTFRQDREFVSIQVMQKGQVDQNRLYINERFLEVYNLESNYIERLRNYQRSNKTFPFNAVFAGQVEVRNATLKDGAPMITVGVPLETDGMGGFKSIAVADIRLDRLQKVFGNISERTLYLVDSEGRLLAHPNEDLVFSAASMIDVPVVNSALTSQFRQGQVQFKGADGVKYTAAYTRTALGVTVIAAVSEDVILEAARVIRREAVYVAGRILSVAIFLIFWFSITLSSPIERLVDITKEIAKGNFGVKANIGSRDEVGELALAFDNMTEGLQERDKVKNMLNKFHGSSVAEDLLKGDLALGGSRKQVTVFFSDIRDFTKFSEGHTPEEVVEMLNEYFQVMVGIINRHGGIVDKFIGDAIMAVWGAPTASETDAYNAVKACLEMRQSLERLNESRIERGQDPIKIGMGLHTGYAISGTIGSDERMEYTVIGDAVNQASRIEASTKAFGTDLLLSDTVADEVAQHFIVDQAGRVEVKGKSKPLVLFKVRGYYSEQGETILVKTAYSDYNAEAADKVKVS